MRISGNNAGYTMFRGSVKSTGYPFHSPVSPSLRLPWVTVCHHISTGLYRSQRSHRTEAQVYRHSIRNPTLEGREWSARLFGRFYPMPIVQDGGWASGPVCTARNISSPPAFDPRIVCFFLRVAAPTELSRQH